MKARTKILKTALAVSIVAKETFGFSAKRRYIVPQVGIYTLYSKSLTLVFKGSVSSIITNFRVSRISVRIVVISFGRTIYKFLYSLPTFIKGYVVSYNLSLFSTY